MSYAPLLPSPSPSGIVQIAYQSWGKADGKPLVCVHGLTGSSADFKFVGQALAKEGYFVVAPDMPGRGRSEFLKNPDLYIFEEYLIHIKNLLAHLQIGQTEWLGVSMGGLLGICLAGEDNSRITRMILSDVGPEVPAMALDMIRGYLSLAPAFSTMEDVVNAFKQSIGTPFYRGPMTEEEWLYYASTHVRQNDKGLWGRSFDPQIMKTFGEQPVGHTDLWDLWEKITQPVLTIHGGLSLILTHDIAARMGQRKTGTKMDLVTLPDCGHVPSLYPAAQIKIIEDWLKQPT